MFNLPQEIFFFLVLKILLWYRYFNASHEEREKINTNIVCIDLYHNQVYICVKNMEGNYTILFIDLWIKIFGGFLRIETEQMSPVTFRGPTVLQTHNTPTNLER